MPSTFVQMEEVRPCELPRENTESSYAHILKSTAWVGGSSVINILIGIARTKAMAILLGPGGVGLAGLYMSVSNLAQSIAGVGVNSSGVRQIAEAVGSGDKIRIASTATVLRRTSFGLGALGALFLIVLADAISTITFGSSRSANAVRLLSAVVFLQLVAAGQGALIQGMRRIADLAKVAVVGSFMGTIATIALIYVWGKDGVVPSLVAVAATTLVVSSWYTRNIPVPSVHLSLSETYRETSALLKLGTAFMLSNLLMMGSAYAIRIILLQSLGMEATGLYQAAWTLGGLYVGMILQAMGADFYPRLTEVAHDRLTSNRLVNEQARVSLLLAGPGVLATITFAPVVVSLFYNTQFTGAIQLLRWICLGVALRVISWPMGFIIMAQGQQRLIILCEVAWTAVHLGLALILVKWLGLNGAGIAFFGSYVFHIVLNYAIVHRLNGFRWSAENKNTGFLYLALIAATFSVLYIMPRGWALCFGTAAALLFSAYAYRTLADLVPLNVLPLPIQKFLLRI